MAKANSPKSGDELAGIAARDPIERVAARAVLAEVTLKQLRENPVVPYEIDEVTRVVEDSLDARAFAAVAHLSVAEFREWLLDGKTTGQHIRSVSMGLTPEMAAATCKLMSNLDLMTVSAKCEVVVRANSTLGLAGRLSSRLQPNHPTDHVEGILASTYEGLSYGCGDAVIGINPATDTPESTAEILRALEAVKQKHKIPTQHCVLSHITVQMKALDLGCPMDLMFQSIAGTEGANRAFGISVALLDEAAAKMQAMGSTRGPNRMYFETGQGSALSSAAHHDADQQTIEARAYGLADGLSAVACMKSGPELFAATKRACEKLGMTVGAPVCAKFARVWLQDEIGAVVGAKVALILLGERPGLGTGDGLSAYAVYQPKIGNTDGERNMMSNIHERGVPPADAAPRLASLVAAMLEQKRSGVTLDLAKIGTGGREYRAPQIREQLVTPDV